ncbi:MAG: hypothetical protein A3D31_17490 [Candidatus Fluviicola riflensis]|nr:MAG: hypothetical protein CHH17_02430 [Candidatus Fluviicola riflensis]OGS76778.1 MAG: hypothetical protein A3D31_17490 [Candidatus Fluviicola riflensis]OGS82867.1 MAG: hypothetical protein A2724_13870 [Fluviicola sp. RIFCSPHIGHO2_01_FULL_43_53]OGS88508.1 MAG: hypothetical protein A3E30_06995 [Fluviicola sp. RIFCSPHIGHO2_12_FULL_43_24]
MDNATDNLPVRYLNNSPPVPLPSTQSQPTQIVVSNGNEKKGVWRSLKDEDRSRFAKWIALGIVGVCAAGAIWLIDRKVKKVRARAEENKSFGKDKHSTWAKQFRQAFDNDGWWGTDVPLVRQTMRAIPSKTDFEKVQNSYKTQYEGANLIHDLADELTKTEYEEMLAIKNAKPQTSKSGVAPKVYDPEGWAKRLHAAMSLTWFGFMPATDEEAIEAVFQEFPNQQAFYNTAAKYKKMYGVSLWTDLDGDLDWSWDWRAELKKKPKK